MIWVGVALWAVDHRAAEADGGDPQLRRDQRFGLGGADPCGRSGPGPGLWSVGDLLRHPELRPSVPQTTWGSFAAVATAILAVVRFGLAKAPGGGATGGGGRLAKLFNTLKHVLLPWAALIVIIVAALTVLMRWIAVFVGRPVMLADWPLIYGFAIVLVVLTLFTDANWTSLHHFYRERISYAFLQQRAGGTTQPLSYREPLRFSQSAPRRVADPNWSPARWRTSATSSTCRPIGGRRRSSSTTAASGSPTGRSAGRCRPPRTSSRPTSGCATPPFRRPWR